MISDEDRARLGEIAMRAIDTILEEFGEDATLEDAVLVYEVSYPEDDEVLTEINAETTTHRATVAGGIASSYAHTQLAGWTRKSDEDE